MTDEGKEMCKLIIVIVIFLILAVGVAHLLKRIIPRKDTYRQPIVAEYVKEVHYDT